MEMNYDPTDPLAILTAPPPNETQKEKAERETREAAAQRNSDQIDGKLSAEKAALREQSRAVKILLVGQSGDSGNIAFLRHFLLRYARVHWAQELALVKIVLRFKLVHSVNMILDALQAATEDEVEGVIPVTSRHHRLRLRLRPLRDVESYLKRLLGEKAEDTIRHFGNVSSKLSPNLAFGFYDRFPNWHSSRQDRSTDCVDALNGEDAIDILRSCKCHILALWTDPVVHEMVERCRIHIDDHAKFCLDNSERLTARDYEPTDDDILYARLCMPGVREHEFKVTGNERAQTWKIYDLGGSRTQRHMWMSYFDQVDSIVFFVSASCFTRQLKEDPKVNQLEDALNHWKAICSSTFLSRTNLVLLLHKTNILVQKIAAGVMVNHYIVSYGDRPNNAASVLQCRSHFRSPSGVPGCA